MSGSHHVQAGVDGDTNDIADKTFCPVTVLFFVWSAIMHHLLLDLSSHIGHMLTDEDCIQLSC